MTLLKTAMDEMVTDLSNVCCFTNGVHGDNDDDELSRSKNLFSIPEFSKYFRHCKSLQDIGTRDGAELFRTKLSLQWPTFREAFFVAFFFDLFFCCCCCCCCCCGLFSFTFWTFFSRLWFRQLATNWNLVDVVVVVGLTLATREGGEDANGEGEGGSEATLVLDFNWSATLPPEKIK